jgi:hypothetical protein
VIVGLTLVPVLLIDSGTDTIGLEPDLIVGPAVPGLPPLTRLPGKPVIEETDECGDEAFDLFPPVFVGFRCPVTEMLMPEPADDFLVDGGVPLLLPNGPTG